MEVSRSNPSPLTGPSLRSAVQAWRVGQVLQAVALTDSHNGKVDLAIGGRVITAETSRAVQEGARLSLRVKTIDRQVVLQVAQTAPPADPIRTALRRLLPKQAPLKPVLERLLSLERSPAPTDASPTRTGDRPPPPARPDPPSGNSAASRTVARPTSDKPGEAFPPSRATNDIRIRLERSSLSERPVPSGTDDTRLKPNGRQEMNTARNATPDPPRNGPDDAPPPAGGRNATPPGQPATVRGGARIAGATVVDTGMLKAFLAQLPDREELASDAVLRAVIDRARATFDERPASTTQKLNLDVLSQVLREVRPRLSPTRHGKQPVAARPQAQPPPGLQSFADIQRVLAQPVSPTVGNDAVKALDALLRQLRSLLEVSPSRTRDTQGPSLAPVDSRDNIPSPVQRARQTFSPAHPPPKKAPGVPDDGTAWLPPSAARSNRQEGTGHNSPGMTTDPSARPRVASAETGGRVHVLRLIDFVAVIRQKWSEPIPTGNSPAVPAGTSSAYDAPLRQVPEELARQAAELLSRLPDGRELGKAEGLRRALLDSGLFLEARLAAGDAAAAAATDLKAGLLRLLFRLRELMPTTPTPAAPSPAAASSTADRAPSILSGPVLKWASELFQEAEGALSRIQLNQFQSRGQEAGQSQAWAFELPLKHGGQIDTLRIRIERERASHQNQAAAPWHVEVNFDFENLGRIHARINIQGDTVSTRFSSDSPDAVREFRRHLNILHSRLTLMGLNVGRLSVRQEDLPPEVETPCLDGLLSEKA